MLQHAFDYHKCSNLISILFFRFAKREKKIYFFFISTFILFFVYLLLLMKLCADKTNRKRNWNEDYFVVIAMDLNNRRRQGQCWQIWALLFFHISSMPFGQFMLKLFMFVLLFTFLVNEMRIIYICGIKDGHCTIHLFSQAFSRVIFCHNFRIHPMRGPHWELKPKIQ